jgi:hypothetical protein
VALASASFGLGVLGHLEAGGHAGSPLELALAAGYCALSGLSYSKRQLSGLGVTGVLLGNQVILHLALAIGSSRGSVTGIVTVTDCADGHGGLSRSLVTASHATADHATAGHAEMGLIPSGWMVLAHLVATLLTVGVLVVVEGLCLGLTLLGHWLARVLRVALGPPLLLRRPQGTVAVGIPPWRSRHVGAHLGRGPPRGRLVW